MHIAFDTETYPFVKRGKASSLVVPRLVCLSYYHDGMERPIVLERARAVPLFREWFEDPEHRFVGHNVTFDMLVMTRALVEEYGPRDWGNRLFEIYAQQRVHDTIVHEQLKRIARKGTTKNTGYTLSAMVGKYLSVQMTGKSGSDVWRARYNELEGIPAEKYPSRAYQYAADDAKLTWDLWVKISRKEHYPNEAFQLCADLWLKLTSAHGFMVDQEHTKWIHDHYAAKKERLAQKLREAGIMRPDGTNNTAEVQKLFFYAWRRLGKEPKLTDTGQGISTAKDTLQLLKEEGYFDLEDNDGATMRVYSEYVTASKFISTYLEPMLDAGSSPVCNRYVTVVDSGRTSSQAPNVQNMPAHLNADERRAKAGGFEGPFGRDIRGCVVPRPGKVLIAADYGSIEMLALAQVNANLAGRVTQLGEVLNSGVDCHLYLLAKMFELPYEKVLADYRAGDPWTVRWRQVMKAKNYAAGGMAGVNSFVDYVKGYGENVTVAESHRADQAYHNTFPDVMDHHFANIHRSEQRKGVWLMELHGPNRVTSGWMQRKCTKITQAANTMFQSLTGALAKHAGWQLSKSCYLDTDSVLYDSRILLFVHDEFVIETDDGPEEVLEEKGKELSRLMVDNAKIWLPDLVPAIEADYKVLRERWSK